MKIVVLGDIHGRKIWKNIVEKEKPDLTIFLGDYVSTHDYKISTNQQCQNLEDILQYKENNPDKVILLRGNHDLQHLGYYWAQCSGLFPDVQKWLIERKERFLNLTQWVHVEGNTIFSHAGIGEKFWENLGIGAPTRDNILKINQLAPSELFGFTPSHFSDCYGDSDTQPLTWIRPITLLTAGLKNWGYVVGHTRLDIQEDIVKRHDNYKAMAQMGMMIPELWCIDSLPEKYMVIVDGVKKIETFST